MASALASNNQQDLYKLVEKRLKDMMDKERKERERIFKLQNADPNDEEA